MPPSRTSSALSSAMGTSGAAGSESSATSWRSKKHGELLGLGIFMLKDVFFGGDMFDCCKYCCNVIYI